MKSVRLGDIATLVRGVSFSKEEGNLLSEKGYLPVIRAGSIQESLLLHEGQIWVPARKIKSSQKIRTDDIVMCTSSGSSDLVGKCARSTEDFEGSFGAFCAGIRAHQEKASPSYLYHFLCSPVFKVWTRASSGANIKNIRVSELAEFQVPLPSLPEQKRIAAILDKADAIRRKRQQAIQLADDFLRAVVLDMFGDPVTNPKGWELKTLGELCTKITDGEHGTVKRLESGRLYLMARNIDRKGNLDLSDVSYISEADHQRIYKRCGPEKGDVLLVCVGATIGKALVVPDIGEFSLARSVALLKPGKEIVSEYLLSLINTDALQRQFVSSGNSSAQAGLYLGKIKEIMVPVPGLKEQLRFKEIVNFVKEKFSSKINGGNLESDFVLSLSQKAFSGQL